MMLVEQIARLCHEVNRAYCTANNDHSQPAWENAPQWQRDSAIAGVKAVLANPKMKPWDSHEGWLKQKLEEGWTYGEVKDPEAKTHPCLRPYVELPREQQLKDHLFIAVARTAANL